MYDLHNVCFDRSFDVFRLDCDIALAHGSIGDDIQVAEKGVTPRSLFMRQEVVLERMGLEQRTPQAKPELGCALLKLFNQITYLRDPRGSFAVIQYE